jgi:hypothetical protein
LSGKDQTTREHFDLTEQTREQRRNKDVILTDIYPVNSTKQQHMNQIRETGNQEKITRKMNRGKQKEIN